MPTFKQGDFVRVTELYSIDSYLGMMVGDVYCIERDCPHEGGVMFYPDRSQLGVMSDLGALENEGTYILLYNQIEPVDADIGEVFRKN